MDTLQQALIALYGSLGGDSATIANPDSIVSLITEIAKLNLGAAIDAAAELPALPEDDGTYTLQVTIADGEATYTWEAVE